VLESCLEADDRGHGMRLSVSCLVSCRVGEEETIVLFILALGVIAALVALQRVALWLLARLTRECSAARPPRIVP
jgi:hypothetical protein